MQVLNVLEETEKHDTWQIDD